MRIGLESDFKDYYDKCLLGSNEAGVQVVYKRNKSDMPSKGKGLAILKRLGIPTLKLEATREMFCFDEHNKLVVVYTDPNKHDGTGRVLMRLSEAQLTYPNSLSTEFHSDVHQINKLLYVGSRRFTVILNTEGGLDRGKVVSISEINSMYNYMIGIPIFSIDYIPTSNGLLAMTLNTVERLEDYGLDKILSPEEVVEELSKSILEYKLTEQ